MPNAEVCADKGIYGAICAWTRNGPITKIPVGDWNNRRIGYFCMDARDFGKYQMFIEKACAQDKNCIDEITTFVNNLKGK